MDAQLGYDADVLVFLQLSSLVTSFRSRIASDAVPLIRPSGTFSLKGRRHH
jgi:hypothetical protein